LESWICSFHPQFIPIEKCLKKAFYQLFRYLWFNMDIQFWVWLIVIVITLIARASKKKPQPFDSDQGQSQDTTAETTRPVSFEDLLREIQAAKAPKQKPAVPVQVPKQVAPSKYDFEDYDDNLGEESKSLERTDYYADDKIYDTYENAKKAAFSRASLEDTMKVEDTEVRFNQFKEYSKKEGKGLASQYAKELQNPQSFKRALILSEILNKRF
jgi:hypothetical protein